MNTASLARKIRDVLAESLFCEGEFSKNFATSILALAQASAVHIQTLSKMVEDKENADEFIKKTSENFVKSFYSYIEAMK